MTRSFPSNYDDHGFDGYGYDRAGYDRDGFDERGYDRSGFNVQGFDRSGFDAGGYDRAGYDRKGFDRNGFDRAGVRAGTVPDRPRERERPQVTPSIDIGRYCAGVVVTAVVAALVAGLSSWVVGRLYQIIPSSLIADVAEQAASVQWWWQPAAWIAVVAAATAGLAAWLLYESTKVTTFFSLIGVCVTTIVAIVVASNLPWQVSIGAVVIVAVSGVSIVSLTSTTLRLSRTR